MSSFGWFYYFVEERYINWDEIEIRRLVCGWEKVSFGDFFAPGVYEFSQHVGEVTLCFEVLEFVFWLDSLWIEYDQAGLVF